MGSTLSCTNLIGIRRKESASCSGHRSGHALTRPQGLHTLPITSSFALCLQELPTTGFQLTVMPVKVEGGGGAPVRIIATIPDVDA
ncbi:hypothetical protein Pcinc_028125 [Petrolisthes cinctipes]|uniref:Uncharacterized protein n=1 Tax=Petrolisthes cinctipes TaxID=88211 RepID=A0AAE1F3P3_PETCI|nr:hypothetical protein Pcinc_028125 [Petrolisthes cinctipes]